MEEVRHDDGLPRGDEIPYVPWTNTIRPQDQTVEQWLSDYQYATISEFKGSPIEGFEDPEEEEDMQFAETSTSIDFEPCPIGMHFARCIRIIDLGTMMDQMYQKEKHQVFFMWEVPGELKTYTDKEGKEITEPFTIGKFYNKSLSEGSHLRADLESWRSRGFTPDELQGFDAKKVMGAPCMINVIHTPKKRAKKPGEVSAVVTAVTPLPKGMDMPDAVHPLQFFSLDEGEFDNTVFEALSAGLKSKVMQSNEYRALGLTAPADPGFGEAPGPGHPAYVAPAAAQPQQQAAPAQQPAPVVDDGFDDIPF